MPVILADGLRKEFRRALRGMGVGGALRTMFSRAYETMVAVHDVAFAIPEGQLVGYLGPNGAGKSTTIKMLTGILRPTRGRVELLGLDPSRDRYKCLQQIGVLFGQRSQLWWDIPLHESLIALRHIYALKADEFRERIRILDQLLDLSPLLGVPVRQLSLGQRMRGELAATMLHRPRILFLDEPTIGVDSVGKMRFREFIREANVRDGVTVMLTSHDLADVESICHRVLLLDRGSIRFDGSPSELTRRFAVHSSLTVSLGKVESSSSVHQALALLPPGAELTEWREGKIVVAFDRARTGPTQILSCFDRLAVVDMRLQEATLTDAFIRLYGAQGNTQ